MARPLKPIDAEQVFKLANLGCTLDEIADFFHCSVETVRSRFSDEISRARASWKTSLRRAQTKRAIRDGSDNMLIHLGKTYLGQGDKLQITTKEQPKYIDRANNRRDQQHLASVNGNGNGHTETNGLAP